MNLTPTHKSVVPYSQHYRCSAQLFGNPVENDIFMYIFDEYISLVRQGKNTKFRVSRKQIGERTGIYRQTVATTLDQLVKMKLITLEGKTCTVNANYYVSLIRLYNYSNLENKHKIQVAFHSNDMESLAKMGYVELGDINVELRNLIGGSLHNDEISSFLGGSTKSDEISSQPGKSDEISSFLRPDNNKSDEISSFLSAHTLRDIMQSDEISSFCNNQDDFKKMLYDDFSSLDCINLLDELSNIVYNDEKSSLSKQENTKSDEISSFYRNDANLLIILAKIGSKFVHNQMMKSHQNDEISSFKVMKSHHKSDEISSPENKEINKRKEIQETSSPSKENFEKDNLDIDFSLLEYFSSSYKQIKRKSRLPFFPVNEIESYVSDIRNCLDRADKIFINQVWEIAHELYDKEDTLDENGDVVLPGNTNLEGVGVEKERIKKDLLFPAFDKTQEIVEKGTLTINGEVYPVTATINDPNDFDNIVDWELITLLDGSNYIISSSRFRNIYAEEMEIKPKNIRVHVGKLREDDKAYMQKIVLIGDDDERYNELTAIELVIYNFLNEHFHINLSGEVEEPKTPFVNRAALGAFYLDIAQKGLTTQDFLNVLFNDKPEYGTGSLNLRQRMFSADKIRQWNTLHSYKSIIDDLTVDNLLANKAPTEAD